MPSSKVVVTEVATGTGDVQIVTGQATLFGWSFAESAGTPAVGTIVIRDGTSTSGKIVAVIELSANQSAGTEYMPNGLRINDGIFIDRTAGESQGAVYWG